MIAWSKPHNGDVPLDRVAFHGLIDYKEVPFSLELLEWDRTFSAFGRSENSAGI